MRTWIKLLLFECIKEAWRIVIIHWTIRLIEDRLPKININNYILLPSVYPVAVDWWAKDTPHQRSQCLIIMMIIISIWWRSGGGDQEIVQNMKSKLIAFYFTDKSKIQFKMLSFNIINRLMFDPRAIPYSCGDLRRSLIVCNCCGESIIAPSSLAFCYIFGPKQSETYEIYNTLKRAPNGPYPYTSSEFHH